MQASSFRPSVSRSTDSFTYLALQGSSGARFARVVELTGYQMCIPVGAECPHAQVLRRGGDCPLDGVEPSVWSTTPRRGRGGTSCASPCERRASDHSAHDLPGG